MRRKISGNIRRLLIASCKGEYEMKFFDRFFSEKAKKDVPAMPLWELIVEIMHEQYAPHPHQSL